MCKKKYDYGKIEKVLKSFIISKYFRIIYKTLSEMRFTGRKRKKDPPDEGQP